MSSLLEAPAISGEIALGTRKTIRQHRTTESRIRSTHRRRKVLTRGGVLAGFVLAMVVYPVFGTITPYADAAESIPGVVKGQTPTTAAALLGGGPQLKSSDLPLPSSSEELQAYLVSNPEDAATVIADCNSTAPIVGGNGRLDSSSLCPLWDGGQSLAAEAATALTVMNDSFRVVFGRDICLEDSYRSLQDQFRTKATKGYLAAAPGTSMHGWGLAIDLCSKDVNGDTGNWIRANAPQYGWENPSWAKSSKFEPWHWEYAPLTGYYYDATWGGGYSDGSS